MFETTAQSSLDVPLRKMTCEELNSVQWNAASSSYFVRLEQLTLPVTVVWIQGKVRVAERRRDSMINQSSTEFDIHIADHSATVHAIADHNDLVELDQVVNDDYCAALLELRPPDRSSHLNLRCVRLTPMPDAFHSLWMQELDAYRCQMCK